MTGQLLPPIVSSPFGKHFHQKPYILHGSSSLLSSLPGASSTSLNTILVNRPRQASLASGISIASGPALTNNENLTPFGQSCLPYSKLLRSFSTNQSLTQDTHLTTLKCGVGEQASCLAKGSPADHQRNLIYNVPNELEEDALSRALGELHRYRRTRARHGIRRAGLYDPKSDHKPENASFSLESEVPSALIDSEEHVKYPPTEYTDLTDTDAIQCAKRLTSSSSAVEHEASFSEQSLHNHRQRLSTSSSGFVHTLKTASFSNESFSAMSKSLRLGRSSEAQGPLGSHHRFSVDSERPPTNASLDDAALQRSMKRKQILEELMATEVSYVDDLKALVYLMSTLLASATSISSHLRTSIQQNVLDLLHMHEQLLEQLHRASFQSAARKWADTISPRRLIASHHMRLRSAGSNHASRTGRIGRQKRSSSDSFDFLRARLRLAGTDPNDVSKIVTIFKASITRFFAYEEYCANHEIIAQELQKHIPNLWSTYELGMESLARSLVSLDRRDQDERKGMTVGDLLIKPIQRVCKYPLLLDDLLKQTPVADCPSAHAEIETLLCCFRDIVKAVNTATDSNEARSHIQRRWLLQSRLNLSQVALQAEDIRLLGNTVLCGVLHVTYQARNRVDGAYALCILFERALVIAMPTRSNGKFDVVAFIHLSDLRLESASDGKGLQCQSALHTWKICFEIGGHLHEFLCSACSAIEEDQWKKGLEGRLTGIRQSGNPARHISSSTALDLKSVGVVYGYNGSLARRLSVQRAATVGNRASICQVIVRNTHNPQDLHDFRQPSTSAVSRSLSHLVTHRIAVLAPKRSERARLESVLGDVWTRDKLPFPGMVASRGGQIIRASAGSLARKLSLASIHGPFSRRSASLTLSSRKSLDALSEGRRPRERFTPPTFEVKRDSLDDINTSMAARKPSHDLPELDTMDRVVNRMIGDTTQGQERPSFSHSAGMRRRGSSRQKSASVTRLPIGPEDPASIFYAKAVETGERVVTVEEVLTGRRKRWSNPMSLLKGFSAEGIRNMLYSSK